MHSLNATHTWARLVRRTGLTYFILFAGAAAIFLFFGPILLKLLNEMSRAAGYRLVSPHTGTFWLVLTISMMTNISLLAWLLRRDPFRNYGYFRPLIMSKYTSALLGLILFLGVHVSETIAAVPGAGSLTIFVIFCADFPLGLWAHYLYRRGAPYQRTEMRARYMGTPAPESREEAIRGLANEPSNRLRANRLARMAIRLGVPTRWTESSAFREDVYLFGRPFAQGRGRGVMGVLFDTFIAFASWKPVFAIMEFAARFLPSAGRASIVGRVAPTLAFSNPDPMQADGEIYEPIIKSPKRKNALIDLTNPRGKLKDKIDFHYGFGNEAGHGDSQAMDAALAGDPPDYICIGSGPGSAAAIVGLLEEQPGARVWILDQGDYFTQDEYDSMSPLRSVMSSYLDNGFSPIVNSPGRVTVGVAPAVWGGGSDIFSGTAVKNEAWYISRMGMDEKEYNRYYKLIAGECDIGPQKWELVSEAQKRFWKGAKHEGHTPFLLHKFGRNLDEGRGRDYAGAKGRIPYLDKLITGAYSRKKGAVPPRGIANCRVTRLRTGRNGAARNDINEIEVEFLGRADRKSLGRRTIRIAANTRILLGAGSPGNYKLLGTCGIKSKQGRGVLHQYTTEVLGLFDDEMPANGNPQALGVEIAAEEVAGDKTTRRIVLEGAHPGRAVLSGIGAPGPVRDVMALRAAQKRIGCMGVMFTEETPGRHKAPLGATITLQSFTPGDRERLLVGVESALRIWSAAGASALGLNVPVPFKSRDPELRAIGFFRGDEIESALEHIRRHPPQMQTFYRTGNLHGILAEDTGAHPELNNVFVVSEDSIPAGPGVNPTLALLIQARRAGRNIARK